MTESGFEPDGITELLSRVVHDLKGPVIATKGFLDLVAFSGELNEKQTEFLQKADTALNRMSRLITTILDFARIGSDTELCFEPLDLHEVVKSEWVMLEDLAAKRDITFEVEEKPGTFIVNADLHYVSQIFHNLLINAINYNRDGGKIIVKLSIEDGLARVDVADTGLGIATDQLGMVFERFYRAKILNSDNGPIQRGTGLGLAIAKAFVELHQGDIWVESTLNVGSTFTFTLPVEQPEQQTEMDQARRGSSRFSRLPDEDPSEEPDAVDDDSQEAQDSTLDVDDYDSRGDEP
jgi:two-component system phosphate regulon sensor histidine kinase PhoR